MYYVELLRIIRGLRVVGIILGIIFLIAIVFRLIFLQGGSPDSWVRHAQLSPGAHVTTRHLANGLTRTIVDDPADRTHVVVDDRGYSGKHITIIEPSDVAQSQNRHGVISMGSMNVTKSISNGMSRIDFETNSKENLATLFMAAMPIALIFATIIACALARENDGHLELAWTKPVSRDAYALSVMGLDLAGIAVTVLASVVVFLITTMFFELPRLYLDAGGAGLIALVFTVPMAWYALLTAASASLRRGYGAVIGTAWPVAFIIPALIGLFESHSGSSVAAAIVATLRTVNTLNPIAIYFNHFGRTGEMSLIPGGVGASIVGSIVLLVVYVALAVLQWRRVEA
ncbi:MAG TPA: hypothetical protein VIG51_04250 [Candidatus Baltobacteraceae bacterium]|jgi:hypothetical protein